MIDNRLGEDMFKMVGLLAGIGLAVLAALAGIIKLIGWIRGLFK